MDHSLYALVLGLLLAPAISAENFPCTAAHTAREKAVCASPELSALDDKLGAAYKAVRAQLSPASAAEVTGDQREWLGWIDKICARDENDAVMFERCLVNEYTTRSEQLSTGVQTINGMHFYTRAHFVYRAAPPTKKPAERDSHDPGYGYGEFAWPQIDRPDNDQTVWNRAVREQAVKIEGARGNGKTPDMDLAVTPEGSIADSFSLFSANDRLIGVDFVDSGYTWGAAHGGAGQSSFYWWLGERRPLVAGDVFREGSGWQQAVVPLTIAGLNASPGPDALWKGKELSDAVAEYAQHLPTWDLSAEGLTFSFGEYSVGPYSSGIPTTTVRWKDLKALLAPALLPETLPARVSPPK